MGGKKPLLLLHSSLFKHFPWRLPPPSPPPSILGRSRTKHTSFPVSSSSSPFFCVSSSSNTIAIAATRCRGRRSSSRGRRSSSRGSSSSIKRGRVLQCVCCSLFHFVAVRCRRRSSRVKGRHVLSYGSRGYPCHAPTSQAMLPVFPPFLQCVMH